MGWRESLDDALTSNAEKQRIRDEQQRDRLEREEQSQRRSVQSAIGRFTEMVKEAHAKLTAKNQQVDVEFGGNPALNWHDGRRLEFVAVDGGKALEVRREGPQVVAKLEGGATFLTKRGKTVMNLEDVFEEHLVMLVREKEIP